MKHKKQNPEKKRFWLGMAGCALVSFTAYAVSYFSSSHIFSNEYNANKNYSVEIYDVIDENNSTGLWPNKEKEINVDFVVKNTGNIPVLLRIRYARNTKKYTGGSWAGPDFFHSSWRYNLSITNDMYKGVFQNEDKFVFNGELTRVGDTNDQYDGYYYYKKVLQPNQSIHHLDGIYVLHNEDISFETFYYNGIDNNKSEVWAIGSKNNLGIGKMLQARGGFYSNIYGRIKADLSCIFARVETIRAVKSDGKPLGDKDLQDLDSVGLKKLWESMI